MRQDTAQQIIDYMNSPFGDRDADADLVKIPRWLALKAAGEILQLRLVITEFEVLAHSPEEIIAMFGPLPPPPPR